MGLLKGLSGRIFGSYAGVGGTETISANRNISVVGISGAPISGAAGNGAAGAAVNISAFADKDVVVSSAGVTFFRLNADPTAAVWHFNTVAGVPWVLHLPPIPAGSATLTIVGWGIGAAHAFNVVRCDDVT